MSTSSSGSNRSLPFKCSLALAVLLLLAELLAVSCVHNDADNQLVALEEEENNDLNDLNPVSEEFERADPSIVCKAPKYRPYLTVTRATRTEIEFNVTDPNGEQLVDGYLLVYWGFRLGPKSSYRLEDRHFGHKNFTKEGPFVITNLRPQFSYCGDLASFNMKCGFKIQGPWCMGCFEQVLTL